MAAQNSTTRIFNFFEEPLLRQLQNSDRTFTIALRGNVKSVLANKREKRDQPYEVWDRH